jgi:succinyl-CoA synthetase alpha subunit
VWLSSSLYVGIAIGGDTFPGSTLSDHCIRYQNIPQIKMIVVLGELGGTDEYSLVNALKAGRKRSTDDADQPGVASLQPCRSTSNRWAPC